MATIGHSNLNAKLVLLGDMGAGKSSLVLRFVKGQFLEFQESTIGAAFFSQTLAVNDATVKFEIWDTAGQERYHSLAPMYYRGAAAAIIVYDITNLDSFTRAKKWVQELQKQGNPNMVVAFAGNKADLEDKRKVTAEEARVYAEENGLAVFAVAIALPQREGASYTNEAIRQAQQTLLIPRDAQIQKVEEGIELGAYEQIPGNQRINLFEILGDQVPSEVIKNLQQQVDQIGRN